MLPWLVWELGNHLQKDFAFFFKWPLFDISELENVFCFNLYSFDFMD